MDAPTSSFTALKHDGSSGEEEDVAFLKDVDAATAYQAKTVSDLASRRNWWAFWILGTINNLGYVVVLSGAKSLVEGFHEKNLIGLVNWADVALGIAAKVLHTIWGRSLSFHTRVFITFLLFLLGLLGVALSPSLGGFPIALVAISLIGAASALGESVILGYLKLYPSSLTGAWSAGTGMAGVGGSALYLVLSGAASLSNGAIFAVQVPTAVIYAATFYWMVQKAPTPLQTHRPSQGSHLEGYTATVESTKQRYARIWKLVSNYVLHLTSVYFFEYVVSVGCADRANPDGSEQWAVKNAYTILAFCYQFGVLLSRSSLSLLRVRRIWILTLLQGCNFILWMLQAKYHFMGIWVQFVSMVFVGLLGGAMYVNVFALLVDDPSIPDADRELAINIVSIFNNVGITAASMFDIFMDKVLLPQ